MAGSSDKDRQHSFSDQFKAVGAPRLSSSGQLQRIRMTNVSFARSEKHAAQLVNWLLNCSEGSTCTGWVNYW